MAGRHERPGNGRQAAGGQSIPLADCHRRGGERDRHAVRPERGILQRPADEGVVGKSFGGGLDERLVEDQRDPRVCGYGVGYQAGNGDLDGGRMGAFDPVAVGRRDLVRILDERRDAGIGVGRQFGRTDPPAVAVDNVMVDVRVEVLRGAPG